MKSPWNYRWQNCAPGTVVLTYSSYLRMLPRNRESYTVYVSGDEIVSDKTQAEVL